MDKATQNQNLLYGLIGLLLGIVLTVLVINNQMYGMMRMMGMGGVANSMMSMHDESGMSMEDMVHGLEGKTGDDFDKAFISGMIVHHEGAIDMANEAKKSAKHEEIKKMADEIIAAQSREIDQMNQWYKDWYGSEPQLNIQGMRH